MMTEKAKIAKQFFATAYWANMHIDSKLRQVQNLRSMATRITQQFGGESVSHSRNPHSMEDSIVKIISFENELDAEIDALVERRMVIKEIIDAVSDRTERLILELRYESFCGWPEVEAVVRLSRSRIFKHHARALETAYGIMAEKGLLNEKAA